MSKQEKKKNDSKSTTETKKVDKVKKVDRTEKVLRGIEKIDENRKVIYALVGGILLGVFVNMLFWPDRIAKLENGAEPVAKINGLTVTATDLYEDMKGHYSVSLLLDKIDDYILTKKYPSDDDMENSINETADYYIKSYESNGYTEEQFLTNNGFASKDKFIDYLRLDYRRNLYYDEYAKKLVTDKEIDNYYNDEVFGDIDSKHILVEISDDRDDATAKALAQEIIDKLNNGSTFDEVKDEYKDSITYEELGYQAFDASLEEAYVTATKKLDNDTYTKEPVKTSYGYHIIYRIAQKEKPELKDVKDSVIEVIATDKKSNDEKLYYKALDDLREKEKLEFSDTVMKEKYDAYIKNYK